ncbi:S8 family peptidase [Halobacillus litoralis]|uniref:S8 family peptidase n=1 Tax=Halobacillus litoralis TaxID=45668 RepID=UPI0013E8C7B3|nr:S8 family peptidase [Halobacillus litoralis]
MRKSVKIFPINDIGDDRSKEKIPENILEIRAFRKWEDGLSGKEVVIAVIDTGCHTNHPDLKGRIIGGYNFSDEGKSDNYEDLNGHGTHTAGIIASSDNNTGIKGIAPHSSILVLKTLDKKGTGTVKSLIKAVNYAVNWRGPNDEKVKVISMSLGIEEDYPELHLAIKNAIGKNISVVASSGNYGDGNFITNEYTYPSYYNEVISVGAITNDDKISSFSNTNSDILLYAPGSNIYSTYLEGRYRRLTGTSMASPHVVGVIALLLEEEELSVAGIRKKLLQNTQTISDGDIIYPVLYLQ